MRRKYKYTIEVWSRSSVDDTAGGQTVTDTKLGDSWCNIESIPTPNLTDYGLSVPQRGIIIRLRERNDIDYFDQDIFFVYKGLKWVITQITDLDLEGEELEILATSEQ